METLYIVLIVLAVVLFLIGFTIGLLQKRAEKKKVLYNTNTRAIEILDDGDSKPVKNGVDKPQIISSEFLEENLEDEEEMK